MSEEKEKNGNQSEKEGKDRFPSLSHIDSVEEIGTQIGPYKLLSVLGEGAFGIVYRAEQKEPVRRQVALKVIKPGMDSKQVIARFEAERQALALLDHPHIAHVFEAGATGASRPYFVMEYVRGMPITEFCDRNKLDTEQRLRLFIQVCEAIQHAHQKGIIHRDVKPSNILVSVQEDKAIPKVIDFGVAKAISQPLTERTLFTEQGQFIGTPEYMSPEQTGMTIQDVDTRSDIYSLGVVLYELLTGTLPFDPDTLRAAAFDEVIRIIRDEDPPRPSTRLLDLGEKATTVATNRRTDAMALSKRLHKELEWIPLKAMRKEPSRRYRTASELADDIRNYLNGDPLLAGPESRVYRTRKFARKYAGPIVSIAVILVVLVAGLVASTFMYFKAEDARQNETDARLVAEQAQKTAEQEREVAKKAQAFAQEQREVAEKEAEARLKAQLRAEDLRQTAETARQLSEHRNYVLSIRLAQRFVNENQHDYAKSLLTRTTEAFRNWEYGYLLKQCSLELKSLVGHSGGVQTARFSSDGRRIVSASGGPAIIWHAASGTKINTINARVSYAAFNEKGDRIVTFSGLPGDQTAIIWDADEASRVVSITHSSRIGVLLRDADFSPDGNRIITTSLYEANIWDTKTGGEILTIESQAKKPSDYKDMFDASAFDPKGKNVAIAAGAQVKIFDSTCGKQLITLEGHSNAVFDAAYSPDGKRIASASVDKTAKIWDAENGKELVTLNGHTETVTGVCFSPDSQNIVTASFDHTARIWSVKTGNELKVLRGHSDPVYCASYSPDGTRIVTASTDGTVKIWDAGVTTWPIRYLNPFSRHQLLPTFRHLVNPAYSPDGKYIVYGSKDGSSAEIREVQSDKTILTLKGHREVISGAFDLQGRRVVTFSHQPTAKIWNSENGELLVTLTGHENSIFCADFSPNGKLIATGSIDSTARVWDTRTGQGLHILRGHSGTINGVFFSYDSKRIVTASADKTAKIWDVDSGKEMIVLKGHSGQVMRAIFSPDASRVITTCSDDKTARVWDAKTGEEIVSLKADLGLFPHPALIDDTLDVIVLSSGTIGLHVFEALPWRESQLSTVSTDGQGDQGEKRDTQIGHDQIAPKSLNGTVKPRNAPDSPKLGPLRGHEGSVGSIAFRSDGKRIVSGSEDGIVKVWDASTGTELTTFGKQGDALRTVPFNPGIIFVGFSQDGRCIISASKDRIIKSWDASTGDLREMSEFREGPVDSIAFSPDAKRIALGDSHGIIKIRGRPTGVELTLRGHGGGVSSVAFSLDGKRVASGSDDRMVKVWDVSNGSELITLRGHENGVNCVVFSPNSKHIASGSDDHTVKVWDVSNGSELITLRGHENGVNCVVFSQDGDRIASCSLDKTVRIWNIDISAEVVTQQSP